MAAILPRLGMWPSSACTCCWLSHGGLHLIWFHACKVQWLETPCSATGGAANLLACSFLQLLLLPQNASTGLQVGPVHLSLCNQGRHALLHPDQHLRTVGLLLWQTLESNPGAFGLCSAQTKQASCYAVTLLCRMTPAQQQYAGPCEKQALNVRCPCSAVRTGIRSWVTTR